MANEETINMKKTIAAPQPVGNDKKQMPWKMVSIGGVSGVMLGAGAFYAADAYARHQEEGEADTYHTLDNGLKVAEVSDDLSFKEAFDLARSEVGPGGVFHWRGNTYGTYNADEWKAMSEADKAEFAELVRPEISAEEIGDAITDGPALDAAQAHVQPQEVHVHNHYYQSSHHHSFSSETSSVHVNATQETLGADDSVRVIDSGTIEGHDAVSLDLSNDGKADVLVVDVNDNHILDEPDIVVDAKGNMATVGQLIAEDGYQNASVNEASMEEPQTVDSLGDEDSVQVLESGIIYGHEAVALDLTNNGEADVIVIDANDNYQLDSPDIVVDSEGNIATIGELMDEDDSPADCANMEEQQDMMPGDDMEPSTSDFVDDTDFVCL